MHTCRSIFYSKTFDIHSCILAMWLNSIIPTSSLVRKTEFPNCMYIINFNQLMCYFSYSWWRFTDWNIHSVTVHCMLTCNSTVLSANSFKLGNDQSMLSTYSIICTWDKDCRLPEWREGDFVCISPNREQSGSDEQNSSFNINHVRAISCRPSWCAIYFAYIYIAQN